MNHGSRSFMSICMRMRLVVTYTNVQCTYNALHAPNLDPVEVKPCKTNKGLDDRLKNLYLENL